MAGVRLAARRGHRAAMPGEAIAVTVVGALVLSVVVAAVPARAAARVTPADALPTE